MASKIPTSPIKILPPECLELIFLNLATDLHTLSSLLRVSRLFFSLTIPILYSDPFSMCPCGKRFRLHKVILDSAMANGCFSLKEFLDATRGQCGSLDCYGQCEHGARLQAIMDTEQAQERARKTAEFNNIGAGELQGGTELLRSARTTTMARYVDFLTHYDSQLWFTFANNLVKKNSQHHLTTKLLVHIHTQIIDQIAERLVSMVLLPGTIRDIIPIAHRLRSLVRLKLAGRYNSDELKYVCAFLSARQRNAGSTSGVRGIEDLTLPLMHSPQSRHPVINQDQLARQIQLQQLEILRSLGTQLFSLDANYCSDFLKIAHQIPCHMLKSLKTFKFVQGSLDGNAELFLRRCRALSTLDFATFHRDVFSWAVHEKLQLTQPHSQQQPAQTKTAIDASLSTSSPSQQSFSSALVQLKHLRLAVSQWLVGKSLHSTTFAFSHSLESLVLNVYDHNQLLAVLCGHAVARIENTAPPDTPFQFNPQTLQLPLLKKLHLRLRMLRENSFVTIGTGAPFEGCPLLEDLLITGSVAFPTVPLYCGGSGLVDALRIPRLRNLELQTRSARDFRFCTLQFSPLLESLVLIDSVIDLAHVPAPPPQYIGTRIFKSGPTTPWTFTMNHLTKMHLTGSPAFQFHFHWIQHCPALTSLVIDGLLPSSFNHLQDPETHVANGHEGVAATADVQWGKHLTQCYLDIFTQPQDPQINRQAFAAVLETYCHYVQELKLNTCTISRYLPTQQPVPAPTPTLTPAPIADAKDDDLGLALYISRNLPHLKRLATNHGLNTISATQLQRYGLVQGRHSTVQRDDNTGGDNSDSEMAVVWCPSIVFKPFQIELLGNMAEGGHSWFRQRASWQFSDAL